MTLRRAGAFVGGAIALALAFALIFQRALLAFGGARVGVIEALFVVTEAFTTIGFGRDTALCTTPEMLLMVMLLELTGLALVFLTVPAFVLPLVKDETVADYHRYAGADDVASPRRLLGESLAAKAMPTSGTGPGRRSWPSSGTGR